jgi:hypothetical protein
MAGPPARNHKSFGISGAGSGRIGAVAGLRNRGETLGSAGWDSGGGGVAARTRAAKN